MERREEKLQEIGGKKGKVKVKGTPSQKSSRYSRKTQKIIYQK